MDTLYVWINMERYTQLLCQPVFKTVRANCIQGCRQEILHPDDSGSTYLVQKSIAIILKHQKDA